MEYLEILELTFREIAEEKAPELNKDSFVNELSEEIKKKKYDVQDQTFIETALKDDKESFIETFNELLGTVLKDVEKPGEYLKSQEGKKAVMEIYIKNIEYTVDLFYNAIISKQFSET